MLATSAKPKPVSRRRAKDAAKTPKTTKATPRRQPGASKPIPALTDTERAAQRAKEIQQQDALALRQQGHEEAVRIREAAWEKKHGRPKGFVRIVNGGSPGLGKRS